MFSCSVIYCQPLLPQDGVPILIHPLALQPHALAEKPLMAEAQLGHHSDRGCVVRVDVGADPVQVELLEKVIHHAAYGFAGVAIALMWVRNGHTDLCLLAVLEKMESTIPDHLTIGFQINGQLGPLSRLAGISCLHPGSEFRCLLQTIGCFPPLVFYNFWVGAISAERLDILFFKCAQDQAGGLKFQTHGWILSK